MKELMKKAIIWIELHITKTISIPLLLSALTFCVNFLKAVKDGILSPEEIQTLTSGASGVEIIVIGVALLALKNK